MSGVTRNVRIEVSSEHFALLADAMCMYSKKTGKFQSFRATVQEACHRAADLDFSAQDLSDFLSAAPSTNTIALWLEVKSDWMSAFDAARAKVFQISEKPLHDRLAIPFIVGRALASNVL